MAAFATPEELATYLRTATQEEADAGNPDVLDTTVAELLLDNASAAIRDACGWSITEETVTDQPVSHISGRVFLPTKHLTALAISVDGVDAVVLTDYVWSVNGVVRFVGWGVGSPSLTWAYLYPQSVVLATYTHGYDEAPQSVKAVCLEHAAAAYPNPSRYRSETIEGVVTVYAGVDLETEPRLNRFRLPRLG